MLSDPTIVKLIIMGLVGTNVVLLVAVIFLAFKKNTYYVDADGNDVGTTRKPQVKNVVQATPIAPKPEPVQQPNQHDDNTAKTTRKLMNRHCLKTTAKTKSTQIKMEPMQTDDIKNKQDQQINETAYIHMCSLNTNTSSHGPNQ